MKVFLGLWFGVVVLLGILPVGIVSVQVQGAEGANAAGFLTQVVQTGEDTGELKVSDILISVALLVLVLLFGWMIFSG